MGSTRIGSKTRIHPSAMSGDVTGKTAKFPVPSDSGEVSPSSATIAWDTAPTNDTTADPTPSVSSTIPTSVRRTVSDLSGNSETLLVRDFYANPEAIELSPAHAAAVAKLAVSYGIDSDLMLRRMVTRLLAGPGQWGHRTVAELVQFYLDNLVIP